jgi:hypothetical protein
MVQHCPILLRRCYAGKTSPRGPPRRSKQDATEADKNPLNALPGRFRPNLCTVLGHLPET